MSPDNNIELTFEVGICGDPEVFPTEAVLLSAIELLVWNSAPGASTASAKDMDIYVRKQQYVWSGELPELDLNAAAKRTREGVVLINVDASHVLALDEEEIMPCLVIRPFAVGQAGQKSVGSGPIAVTSSIPSSSSFIQVVQRDKSREDGRDRHSTSTGQHISGGIISNTSTSTSGLKSASPGLPLWLAEPNPNPKPALIGQALKSPDRPLTPKSRANSRGGRNRSCYDSKDAKASYDSKSSVLEKTNGLDDVPIMTPRISTPRRRLDSHCT